MIPVFQSERLEPFVTHLIGVGGMRVEGRLAEFKADGGEDPMKWYELANEMVAFWYLIDEALMSLAAYTAGKGPVHFNLVMGNERTKIARYLEGLGKCDPMSNGEKFNCREFDFDHLLKERP